MALNCFSLANPNPNLRFPPFKTRAPSSSSMASFLSSPSMSQVSVRLESLHRRRKPLLGSRIASPPLMKGLGGGITFGQRKSLSIVSFAAFGEESESSEPEIEMEKKKLEEAGKESQEAWSQALADFKEQAIKIQSVSQEAYEVYSKKATVILKETAGQLKIQADQARKDLTVMGKELSEEGRQYLTTAAEKSPEPVKDVIETFASADDLDDVSKVRDFYVGIPYGALLSVVGFLNFMLTGNVSALRFGVILGGALLALSVSSLRAWRNGNTDDISLKGQAAIAGVLFIRDLGLVFQGPNPFGLLKTIVSGGVTAFFIYRITYDKQHKRPNLNGEAQS